MLRLRTSTGLSVLALAIGIAGTGWLSTLTNQWSAQPLAVGIVAHRTAVHGHQRPVTPRGPISVAIQRHHKPHPSIVGIRAVAKVPAANAPIELIPLTTPSDNSRPWYQLQGHLDGRVVLHLTIDGSGRVITAAMRQSSGDPILDDHALRSVRQWRFAVPSGHPDGFSGDLPMRFASGSRQMAQAA